MRHASLLALIVCSSACAGPAMSSMRMAAAPSAVMAEKPAPLDRSYFARDPQGSMSEDDLQKVLGSPLELDLPARVGVVPVLSAEDWHGPSPDYKHIPAGVHAFVDSLRGADPFTVVTEVLPIPNGGLGMEALRQVAARYALRYVILYQERIDRHVRVNGAAALYVTILGALFVPGQTLEAEGYLEATVFDVKTGLLLFTVRRAVRATESANVWYPDLKLDRLQAALVTRFSPKLGEDLRGDIGRFALAVKAENARHGAPVAQVTP